MFDSLPSDRDYQASVYLIGEFRLNNHLHPPSYTYINGHNAILKPGPDLDNGSNFIDERVTRDGTWLSDDQAEQQILYDGLYLDGVEQPVIDNLSVISNGLASDSPGVKTSQYRGVFRDCTVYDNTDNPGQTTGIEFTSDATDVDLRGTSFYEQPGTPIVDNGTRTRWNGVIGGGMLGGVDLGTTTGQWVGDEAMADGTTGTAYLHARWTGSGWQPSDGSTVI